MGRFVDNAAVGIHLLLQFDSDDDRFSKHHLMDAARALHLPRINASNHLRRAISSLAREKKALAPSIHYEG